MQKSVQDNENPGGVLWENINRTSADIVRGFPTLLNYLKCIIYEN